MNTYLQRKSVPVALLAALMLALICSACASTPTTSTTPATPSVPPTPTQPVSAQQLLDGPVTYVALGASDAVGLGSKQPATQGYVPLLAKHLPQGSHLVNLGVSGIRLHEALKEELPRALAAQPKLITIWLVANDFVGKVPYASYMHDLNTLLQQLRAGTKARIVMANLPDLTLLPAFAKLTAQQKATMLTEIKRWNAAIASIAAHYTVTLLDLFARQSLITAHPEYVSADGFHPSAAGYAELANLFWQAINNAD